MPLTGPISELDGIIGTDRLPTWEDEASLRYIRALIKEVHRWAPIGSLGVPHATTKDDIYDKQKIPAGTIVFPNLTALSRDKQRYQNPDLFDPARFLGDDLDASASALHPDYEKRDHFHYGFGRRLCQGIFVAEASLFIVISRVLWAFDISPVEGGPPLDMDDKMGIVVPIPSRCKFSNHVQLAWSRSRTRSKFVSDQGAKPIKKSSARAWRNQPPPFLILMTSSLMMGGAANRRSKTISEKKRRTVTVG